MIENVSPQNITGNAGRNACQFHDYATRSGSDVRPFLDVDFLRLPQKNGRPATTCQYAYASTASLLMGGLTPKMSQQFDRFPSSIVALVGTFTRKARRRNDPRRRAVTALYRAHRRETSAKQRRRSF
jgi:hypothetical protein